MSEHTKGEWTIELVGVAGNPDHRLIIGHPNPNDFHVIRTIGRLFAHGTKEETIANARLIATAPKLKIMCESNIVYFRNLKRVWENSPAEKEMLSVIDDIIRQNEDIIAEAEVEE